MTPEPSFESLSYTPFSIDCNLTIDAKLDPYIIFFQNISFLDTKYFNDNTQIYSQFSIIRSMSQTLYNHFYKYLTTETFYTLNSFIFKKVSQQRTQFSSKPIKYMGHLKEIDIL